MAADQPAAAHRRACDEETVAAVTARAATQAMSTQSDSPGDSDERKKLSGEVSSAETNTIIRAPFSGVIPFPRWSAHTWVNSAPKNRICITSGILVSTKVGSTFW